MRKVAIEPITVTLTNALLVDFEYVAVMAVNAKDMNSLIALHAMKVDLSRALVQSVRNGFHEITRGLRLLGVKATKFHVDWAVSKSPESYWHLCGNEGPVFLESALQVALREGKFGFANALLDEHHAPVNDSTIAQLHRPKKPIPQEIIAKLFTRLLESPLSSESLDYAARMGTPVIIDRALRQTPTARPARLLAIAIKYNNDPVKQELLARNIDIDAQIVRDYRRESYPQFIFEDDQKNRIDTNFLLAVAQKHLQLTIVDAEPLLCEFLVRKAGRAGLNGWHYDMLSEQAFMVALVSTLSPTDRSRLSAQVDRIAHELLMPRCPAAQRPALATQVKGMIDLSPSFEFNDTGPAP